MDKWAKYLQLLGLSDTESKIYLEVLKMGPSPVQEIARKIGLSRVSVYSLIESLTKVGLMTSVEKGKKQLYTAEPPERIISLAENKMNNLKVSIQEIKNNIQELKLVQSGDRPVVKMYEGIEAFAAIQEGIVDAKTDLMCEFGNLDDVNVTYPYEALEPFYKKLAKAKYERRLIFYTKTKVPRTIESNKKIKYLENVNEFHGDILFYGDTVWLSGFKGKQLTVMVKSQEIKDTLQAAFDILWKKIE